MASTAINGLGRIGRAELKILEQAGGAEVVAVNDLIASGNLAYLLRYDTVYGRWHTAVTADVTAVTARPVTHEEVNEAFREEAAGDQYRGILGVADDPVVSVDFIGDPRASVVDAAMTRVVGGILAKVMSWYDNEWGFTCRMIREVFAALALPAPGLSQVEP